MGGIHLNNDFIRIGEDKVLEPKNIDEINSMMEAVGSNYHLEKGDGDEIVMVKNTGKQVQRNLFEHLRKED